MKVEICIEDIQALDLAIEHGADRVELCSALSEGGLTPSHGMIEKACQQDEVEVHVLIRPRGGDFVYDEEELEIICNDIRICALLGAKGVVLGIMNISGDLDLKKMRKCLQLTLDLGIECTLHRAFDFVRDPLKTLEECYEMGVKRILTSGQAQKAFDGLELLFELHEAAMGKIELMPGSGINAMNVHAFISFDGIHFSIHKKGAQGPFGMGVQNTMDEQKLIDILNEIRS